MRICRNADIRRIFRVGVPAGEKITFMQQIAGRRPFGSSSGRAVVVAATVGVAVALLALGWPAPWWRPGSGSLRPGFAADFLVVVEAVGILGWWRYTAASFVIVQAATVAYAATGYPPGPSGYAGLAVVGAVAARCERSWVRVGALGAAIGGVAIVEAVRHPTGGPVVGLANAALVGLAWAAGAGIRLARQRSTAVAEAARQAALAQEETYRREAAEARVQAAAELHDRIGHALAAALRQVEAAGVAGGQRREVLLARIRERVQESLIALGEVVTTWDGNRNGRTSSAAQTNLAAQTGSLSAVLGEWIAPLAASGVRVTLSIEGAKEHLCFAAEQALASALDEAVANVARHSASTSVTIDIHFDVGEATLSVNDPGPRRTGTAGAGTGLKFLANRLEIVGGSLRARPTDAGGFAFDARVPADCTEVQR